MVINAGSSEESLEAELPSKAAERIVERRVAEAVRWSKGQLASARVGGESSERNSPICSRLEESNKGELRAFIGDKVSWTRVIRSTSDLGNHTRRAPRSPP